MQIKHKKKTTRRILRLAGKFFITSSVRGKKKSTWKNLDRQHSPRRYSCVCNVWLKFQFETDSRWMSSTESVVEFNVSSTRKNVKFVRSILTERSRKGRHAWKDQCCIAIRMKSIDSIGRIVTALVHFDLPFPKCQRFHRILCRHKLNNKWWLICNDFYISATITSNGIIIWCWKYRQDLREDFRRYSSKISTNFFIVTIIKTFLFALVGTY